MEVAFDIAVGCKGVEVTVRVEVGVVVCVSDGVAVKVAEAVLVGEGVIVEVNRIVGEGVITGVEFVGGVGVAGARVGKVGELWARLQEASKTEANTIIICFFIRI